MCKSPRKGGRRNGAGGRRVKGVGNALVRVSSSCNILPRYSTRRYDGARGRSSSHSRIGLFSELQVLQTISGVITCRPRIPDQLFHPAHRRIGLKRHRPPPAGDNQESDMCLWCLWDRVVRGWLLCTRCAFWLRGPGYRSLLERLGWLVRRVEGR